MSWPPSQCRCLVPGLDVSGAIQAGSGPPQSKPDLLSGGALNANFSTSFLSVLLICSTLLPLPSFSLISRLRFSLYRQACSSRDNPLPAPTPTTALLLSKRLDITSACFTRPFSSFLTPESPSIATSIPTHPQSVCPETHGSRVCAPVSGSTSLLFRLFVPSVHRCLTRQSPLHNGLP